MMMMRKIKIKEEKKDGDQDEDVDDGNDDERAAVHLHLATPLLVFLVIPMLHQAHQLDFLEGVLRPDIEISAWEEFCGSLLAILVHPELGKPEFVGIY